MWTDDRVATLKKLWLEGLSAREVAGQLGGVTRNAVIGKIHRLGLSGAGGAQAQPRRLRPKRPVRPARRRTSWPRPGSPTPTAPRVAHPAPEVAEGPGLIASVLDLNGHVCRWPIGDPKAAGFCFCGRAVKGEGPYCPDHHVRAYQAHDILSLTQERPSGRLLAPPRARHNAAGASDDA